MPSCKVKTFARMREKSMRKLLSCVRENEEALLNQPVKAVCAKQAVIVRHLPSKQAVAGSSPVSRPEPGVPPVQSLAHGHDERVSIANLEFGLKVLHSVINEMGKTRSGHE